MAKTIAILGATGHQGSGLIHALLSDPANTNGNAVQVRALTRDTTSQASQALQKAYPTSLVLVQTDIFNPSSLRNAFADADVVFAMTNNRKTGGGKIETEDDMRHELVQGRNIITALKDCGTQTPHLILSSLPNLSRASNGRFNHVFHFDYKAQIEEWARNELPAVSALHPGLFFSNMDWPQYSRWENGKLRFCAPVSGHQRADWVDPAYDIGLYAADDKTNGWPGAKAIIKKGSAQTHTYPVVSPKIPFSELPRIFTRKTGIPAYFDPISLDEWGSTVAQAAGKGYERDITEMMEWVALAPDERVCYGTFDAGEEEKAREELGPGVRASSFEEWLDRTGWRGPPS